MKKTAIAPSNIAFIKYWGQRDARLRIPSNGSLSINLSNLLSTTTVSFDASLAADDITLNGQKDPGEIARIILHLDRIRKLAALTSKAKVVSINNFPTGTGLSSSASGFAALTLAGAAAAGLKMDEKSLTRLARLASGSACRSIPDGFVEWRAGDSDASSFAVSIYPPDYWDLRDIVAVISNQKKDLPTSLGQQCAYSSPFFETRLKHLGSKIADLKKALALKDFPVFGKLVESEALELHAMMLTSQPPLIYLLPSTVEIIRAVISWRKEGLPVFFTLNTGQDVHLLCLPEDAPGVVANLKKMAVVKNIIINSPARGAVLSEDHLF